MKKDQNQRGLPVLCDYHRKGKLTVICIRLSFPSVSLPDGVAIAGVDCRFGREWLFELASVFTNCSGRRWQMVAARLLDHPDKGKLFLTVGGIQNEVTGQWSLVGPLLEDTLYTVAVCEGDDRTEVTFPLDFTVRGTDEKLKERGERPVPVDDFDAVLAVKRLDEMRAAEQQPPG